MLGGFALAATAGFNVANVGAVASRESHAYGVGLAVVGLFTTALFVTHSAVQVPAGRLCDRIGARVVGGAGLLVVATASAAALSWRNAAFAIALRGVAGFGTAAAFVAGADYVRSTLGSPIAQGLFGAVSMSSGGVALAVVPTIGGWRSPFACAGVVALVGAALVALAPREPRRQMFGTARPPIRDRRLLALGAIHAASFGFSVVVGNWVVTLLERVDHLSPHAAGPIGGLVLFLGIVSRPLGGRLTGQPTAIRASLVAGGIATALLAVAKPTPLAIVAAAGAGLAAGIPFALALTAAQRLLPETPGAAVGAVNMTATVTILVATPLVGLGFSLPGDGRIGFAVVACLWAAAALAVPGRR
jgi:MFS family permease